MKFNIVCKRFFQDFMLVIIAIQLKFCLPVLYLLIGELSHIKFFAKIVHKKNIFDTILILKESMYHNLQFYEPYGFQIDPITTSMQVCKECFLFIIFGCFVIGLKNISLFI